MHQKARHAGLPWHLDEAMQPVQHLFRARKADPDVRLNEGDAVVSRMLWKFLGDALRACEGSVFQAARSRGIGSMG